MDKDKYKLLAYLGVFLILILFIRFNNKTIIKEEASDKETETYDLSYYETIDNDYYKNNVYLTLSGDAITLYFEKNDVLEVGEKNYHNEVNEYLKYNNRYYKLDGEEIKEIKDFIDFPYDRTFTYIDNFKELLTINSNDNLNNNILTKKISTVEVLSIYNKFNNTNYTMIEESNTIIEINMETYEVNLNLTNLYNIINNTNETKVIYNMEFEPKDKEDISSIIEKFN